MKTEEKIKLILEEVVAAEITWCEEVEEDDADYIDDPVIYWDDTREKAGWYWGGDASRENEVYMCPCWKLSELIGGVYAEEIIIDRLTLEG